MTLPSTPNFPPTAPATAGPATPPPVAFTPSTTPVRSPLDWLLAHAAAPIRYRALTEVARLSPTETAQVSNLPFTHAPALLLAVQQGIDGTWEGELRGITGDTSFDQVRFTMVHRSPDAPKANTILLVRLIPPPPSPLASAWPSQLISPAPSAM